MAKILSIATLGLSLALSNIASAETAVTVKGDDTMRFDTTEITAKVGEKITLTFENVGKLPKVAMGHNLVVLKPGSDIAAFAMAAMKAKDTEYVPTGEEKALVVAATKVLGPGETDSLEFTPTEAGEYPFLCSFPGHFSIMQGKIIVK